MERQYLRFAFKVLYLLEMSVCVSRSFCSVTDFCPVDHSRLSFMLALPRCTVTGDAVK